MNEQKVQNARAIVIYFIVDKSLVLLSLQLFWLLISNNLLWNVFLRFLFYIFVLQEEIFENVCNANVSSHLLGDK